MPKITPRERDVLGRVVAGRANKAIAEDMGIGEQAVKAHISRLFLKFRVENRAGLAVAAMTEALDRRSLAAGELERLAREEHRDALRTRAKLLASLVGKDPAVVIDRNARVLLANPAFQRTFVAALYQDERGVKLPADATPLARAARGRPASLRFKLASGPRKGSWWHATGEKVEYEGVGGWTVLVFRRVRGPVA
ncbi:MAG TPA: LuxR C-terminal-related transcriptional regulator [Gemmatimonadaceae bacterium]|nr:LuxR C-terminal-related transcriptional regulator [Gemmatimonadaceae bacterium]